jgi:hypothetical protein
MRRPRSRCDQLPRNTHYRRTSGTPHPGHAPVITPSRFTAAALAASAASRTLGGRRGELPLKIPNLPPNSAGF